MFFSLSSFKTDYVDLFNRLELNDFFLNYYYFFWTNFWYLILFVPLILYTYLYFFEVFHNKLSQIIFLFVLLILFIKFTDYWSFINFNFRIGLVNKNFNILLVNSLNKYHPFIFYTSIMYIIMHHKLSFFYENKTNSFIYSSKSARIIKYNRNNLLAISITLFMGSWWALQEGSWGGWWNWDPSEVFGLFVIIYFLYKLHVKNNFYYFSTNSENTIFFSFIISVFYIFIQLNFDLISHNFTMNSLDIDLTDIFFLNWSSIFLIFSGFILSLFNFYSFKYQLIAQTGLNIKHGYFKYQKKILKIFVILLIIIISLISFFFLINNFLLKIFNLNLLNSLNPINYFLGISLIVLLVFYWDIKNYLFIFFLYYITSCFFLINFLFLNLTLKSLMHIYFFFFLITNICYSSKIFLFWIYSFHNLSILKFNDLIDIFDLDMSLNSLVLETKVNYLVNNNLSDISYNFIKNITSEEQQSIVNFFDFNTLVSLVTKNILFLKFNIFLIDNSIIILFLLFLIILALVNIVFFKKSIIIF
jgi:hypothetical protein